MNVGFIVLSPDRNVAGLKNTIGSIKMRSYNRDAICVVGNDATSKEIKEMKEFCPTFKGKNTITSLINIGLKKCSWDWACFVFGGSRIPRCLEKKWNNFCKEETHVLYCLAEGKNDFVHGCFNGVLINVNFFNKVGQFPEISMSKQGLNDFELAKLMWASDALSHGVIFKGILGARVI